MNGDLGGEGRPGGTPGGGVNGSSSLTSSSSSYLQRSGANPNPITSYSSSPRLRRYEDMKRSYLAGTSTPSAYASTGSTYTSKYGSSPVSPASGVNSSTYRLASLDRLAHRQKLYETNGIDNNPALLSNGSSMTNGTNGNHSVNNLSSNITSITTTSSVLPGPRDSSKEIVNNPHSPLSTPSPPILSPTTGYSALQSKREMFFKADSNGGPIVGAGPPVTHPSTAPPAPPVSANSIPASPAPVPATNNSSPVPASTAVNSTHTNSTHTSVASIKEQLLTTKERKEEKDENKESKIVKELVKERRPREVDGYVGFANLPNQVYRKAVKRGFEFSLMVVGESGLGKSTLINSMFLSDIYSNDHPGPSHRVKKTVQVETTKTLLKENGVNLMLTVVDTPGFGDAVDNSDCWQPVIDYIEKKYEEYLNAESRVNRTFISDTRVHCCLYFIAPSGHGLKPLDVEFMRRLHDKVNIIPVIAKADTLTPDECQHLKKQILNEIGQHKIKIYEFPEEDNDGVTVKMKQKVPFAVVGSNTTVEVDGKKVRGRKYPWGIVEVENMEHCDFIPLRNMMIRTHMQDLKDVSNNVHYENYRCRKLAGIGGVESKMKMTNNSPRLPRIKQSYVTAWNPLAQMEEEKKEHSNRMKKMEAEMEQVFEMKVKEKISKLQDLEVDLQKKNETMRKKLESDLSELGEERERFEKERKAWEAANNITVEELRRNSLESNSRDSSLGSSRSSGLSEKIRKRSPKFARAYSLPRQKFKQPEQCQQQRVDGKQGKKKKGLF